MVDLDDVDALFEIWRLGRSRAEDSLLMGGLSAAQAIRALLLLEERYPAVALEARYDGVTMAAGASASLCERSTLHAADD